jgi:hypothetical protein
VDGEYALTAIDLRLGPLNATGFVIRRSGVQWLCGSGQDLRPNQPFAYCNIHLEPGPGDLSSSPSFAGELDLQAVFAPRLGGRISIKSSSGRGGYLDFHGVENWDPDCAIASIEAGNDDLNEVDASCLRLLVLAGKRMTPLADVPSGLLPSWYSRSRGWWCDERETPLTLLSLGICDATGVVVGKHSAFLEMFESSHVPAQMVFIPDHPLSPAAPVLLDQLHRTPKQFEEIAADLRAYLERSKVPPSADDLMFAGALLSVMQRNPIRDTYHIFSARGSLRLKPAEAILMSLNAEPQVILRHRRLGYHVHIMRHHQAAAGPAVKAWLAESFERVARSVDEIRRDYEALIDAIRRMTGGQIMILNRMSTSVFENVSSYAAFDPPMSSTLSSVAAKELNLMLDDIADSRPLHIIDVDAIAADIGGSEHLPDGIHQSGPMQMVLRREILHILSKLPTPRPYHVR